MQRTVNIYSSQLINNWVIQGNLVRIPLSRSLLTSGTTRSLLLIRFLQESVIKTLNIVRAPNVGTGLTVHVERVFGCRNEGSEVCNYTLPPALPFARRDSLFINPIALQRLDV